MPGVLLLLELLSLHGLVSVAQSVCPEPCICASNVIVCRCLPDEERTILGSFRGIDYISKIYIHTCKKLVIKKDTFKNMAVGQELNIFNIQNLMLEEHAFGHMTKSPNQLVLRDSTIDELPRNVFAGLKNLTNFWLKNVNIGTIRSRAFAGVSTVEYLYFRETRINRLEQGALAGISDVKNLFFRGATDIGLIGANLLVGSTFENVMFEDARIANMHPYALAGLRNAHLIEMLNVTLNSLSPMSANEYVLPTEHLETLRIAKCRFAEFSLGPFSHTEIIRISDTIIEQLSPGLKPLTNITVIHFAKVTINYFRADALLAANKIKDFFVEKSTVGIIESKVFANLIDVHRLVFLNTKVESIHSNVFGNSSVDSLTIDGSNIGVIGHDSFYQFRANFAKFVNSKISELRTDAFRSAECKKLIFESSRIAQLRMHAFRSALIDTVYFISNKIEVIDRQSFASIVYRRFRMEDNTFNCRCDETFRQIDEFEIETNSTVYQLNYRVHRNWCKKSEIVNQTALSLHEFVKSCRRTSASALRSTPTISSYHHELRCDQLLAFTRCQCTSKSNVQLTTRLAQTIPVRNGVLQLRDCQELTINPRAFSGMPLVDLQLVNLPKLQIQPGGFEGLGQLVKFSLSESVMRHLNPEVFSFSASLKHFRLSYCEITNMPQRTFGRSKIDQILIDHTAIVHMQSNATKDADIQNMQISRCEIDKIDKDAFRGSLISVQLIEDIIGAIEGPVFQSPLNLTLEGNQFSCHCAQPALASLTARHAQVNYCAQPRALRGRTVHSVLVSEELKEYDLSDCPSGYPASASSHALWWVSLCLTLLILSFIV